MKKNIQIAYIALFFLSLMISPVSATTGPQEQLRPTLSRLVEILGDADLKGDENKKERRNIIMTTISERFDFGEMSKRVLGATWRDINEEQRKNFTIQMTKLLENNYIGQLENYSGETIEYVGERVKEDRAQVSTLIENNNVKYPVHYIMTEKDGKWMVYDINIEGVSLIRNYRAEFSSILRTEKFDGLMEILKEKNQSFE
ncbi:MAG: ABC transporter substrate-binding protein [Desulfopila sp.]|jgi:phospholipid transport system substrate-binding protein|nr:ABC transporter substrate-binding protein [Desulfopila sp.]